MEEDIGEKLFVRLPSGIRLTPTGEIYQSSFRRIMLELEQAQRASQTLGEEVFGHIRLAAHPIIARTAIPVIEKARDKVPAVDFQYLFQNSMDAIQSVAEYQADFAIVASTFKHGDIKKIKLWSEHIGLYSKSGKSEKVIFANKNMINAERILKKFDKLWVREVNDYDVLLSILQQSSAMGLLPNTLVTEKDSLQCIQKFNPHFDISLIYRTDLQQTAGRRWLIDTLKGHSW